MSRFPSRNCFATATLMTFCMASALALAYQSPTAQAAEAAATGATEQLAIPQLTESAEETEARLKWFRDAKFGLFIHWGPATLSGEEISWGMADRIEGGDHHKKVPRTTYMNLFRQFNPVNFDAEKIVSLADQAGMKYVVFVTKHHDGFCLWPTKEQRFSSEAEFPEHYSIADTPYQGDPVRMMQQAVQRHGMKIGWYYSTRDWTHPEYLQGDQPADNAAYNDYYENQVVELLTEYGPVDIMWFDHAFGNWNQYSIPRLFQKMYAVRPNLLVNNRAAKGLKNIPTELMKLRMGDFDTPENRMGAFQHGRAWESCMILSPHPDHGGWSYRPEAVTRSLTETIRLLSSCVTGDGNMLLNIAPLPDGSLRPEEQAILEGLAPWMDRYHEAIYETRGGPWINGVWGGSTYRNNIVYLHLFEPSDEPIILNALTQQVVAATTIDGTAVPFKYDEKQRQLSLWLPEEARDPHVSIIKLTLNENVTGVHYGPALANETELVVPGTLTFSPTAADRTGTLQLAGKGREARLTEWTDPRNTASWPLEIMSPGTYRIELTSSAAKAGATLAVRCGKKNTYVHVPGTGHSNNFQTYTAGSVTFPNAEKLTLTLTPVDHASWSPIEVKAVKLIPSN